MTIRLTSDGNTTAVIRRLVAEDLAGAEAVDLGPDDRREFARQQIFVHLDDLLGGPATTGAGGPVDAGEEQQLARQVLDELFGLGRLQVLVDDPDVENIDVNGCDVVWVTYADGSKERAAPVADSDSELVEILRSAGSRLGLAERRFDLARPELDLHLPDGSRLSALMAVTARPVVSIRRHRLTDLSLDDLVRLGSLDPSVASLLRAAVRARKNIVVAGAMNAGKTTLLRTLAAEIPSRERLVTIEQSFELGLDALPERHPDLVALEARPANLEGEGLISVADLVRRALRMNADRVIVGEVLGDEILPMLNAMSQGRSGSMCTIHADSSAGVFRRIASYAAQAPERLPLEATNLLIAGAIHFVVYLDTEMHDLPEAEQDRGPGGVAGAGEHREGDFGSGYDRVQATSGYFTAPPARTRFVSSVREVVDAEAVQVVSNEVYRPGPDRRARPASPLRPGTLEELCRFGYEPGILDFSGGLG